MTVAQEQEIARYVERVRRALDDLPVAVRDELLEDLPEHLTEVAAEGDGSLVDRLGPPEAYAVELRTAAGVGLPNAGRNLDDRIATVVAGVRARLRVLDTKVGPLIGYDKASDFLRLLRPAWWVLRGYLATMFVTLLSGNHHGLLPAVDGSVVAGLPLLAMAVIGSIWLGRRSGSFSRWPRMAVKVGSLLAVAFGLVVLANADPLFGYYPDYTPAYNSNPYANVQDVYVYDRHGQLVEGARLFDQDGQPIRLGYPWCQQADQQMNERAPGWQTYPYCPQGAPFRLDLATPNGSPGPTTPPTPVFVPPPATAASSATPGPVPPASPSGLDGWGTASPTPSA